MLRLVGSGGGQDGDRGRQEAERVIGSEVLAALAFAARAFADSLDRRAAIPTIGGVEQPNRQPAATPVPVAGGVAGRLGGPGISISDAITAWTDNLTARGKRPGTLRAFRSIARSTADALGWRFALDIDTEKTLAWMDSRRLAGEWMAVTFNHNLSALQGFTRYLFKTRRIPSDPLACIDRAEDDGGDGSRAATTDEAKELIYYAWGRGQIDRRARGNRALVWCCMFLMGLRVSEPERLQWGDILLDEPIPLTRWRKAANKNRKVQEVALAPELVPLLRAHREKVPHALTDPLFPVTPPRHTFIGDRDAARIPVLDVRGQKLTSHSCRKWLATTLTGMEAHPRVIDSILRHAGGVQGRYAQISLEAQVKALQGLPRLWPVGWTESHQKAVEPGADIRYRGLAKMVATLPNSVLDPAPACGPSSQIDVRRGPVVNRIAEPSGMASGVGLLYGNGQCGTPRIGDDSGLPLDALADLMLDALLRRLRRGPSHDAG